MSGVLAEAVGGSSPGRCGSGRHPMPEPPFLCKMGLNSFLEVTVMGQEAKLLANALPSAGPGQVILLISAASVSGWAIVYRTCSRLCYHHLRLLDKLESGQRRVFCESGSRKLEPLGNADGECGH